MMWPIFWPDDTKFTNPANTRHPAQDAADDGAHLAEHVAAVVAASGTVGDPRGYGETVARELYPDVLSYVVGTPATFGFATTLPRSCCRWSPAPRCRPGSPRRWPATCARPSFRT
jgi:cysteine synthase